MQEEKRLELDKERADRREKIEEKRLALDRDRMERQDARMDKIFEHLFVQLPKSN